MSAGSVIGAIRSHTWLRLLPVALFLNGCGGGGDGSSAPPGSQLAPILQVGMQRQYVGSSTRSVTYANPTASEPDNTLVYSFTQAQTVQQAPSATNATFDVHTDYIYTVTQDPGVGTVPISQSVDAYENLLLSSDAQMISAVGQNSVVVSNDETSNALGSGPYTQTTTTNATYPSARYGFSYPLQTGATLNVLQSTSQNISFTDINASGAAPPSGGVSYTRTRTENDDGSYAFQTAYVNNNSFDLMQNADGSGTSTFTSATASTTTTLGLPETTGGTSSLPVTRSTVSSATGATTNTNYTADDWYPSSGQPDAPLVLQAETVLGPASSLPAQCDGALLRPNIYEIDTTTTNQGTMSPTYSVTTSRAFNADGVTICSLTQQTIDDYDLVTGQLTSTTTTQTQTLLNAINY